MRYLIYITIIMFIILSGCGSDNTASIPDGQNSGATGSLRIDIVWPEPGDENKIIPSDMTELEIIITGSGLTSPLVTSITRPDTTKIITNLPEGIKKGEFKAKNSSGTVLAHRVSSVTILRDQTVVSEIILGVTILNTGFYPQTITINQGDTLYWINNDTVNHTIVADDPNAFNSSTILPGGSYNYLFNTPGTYTYKCSLTGKTGTVVVTGTISPTATATSVSQPTLTPTPANTPTATPLANWQNVGPPGFSTNTVWYNSLYVDNNIPYVAFQDKGNSARATVMKYDGTNWVSVGAPGFSPSFAAYTSLYFYNGIPYLAYQDWDRGYNATVVKYDGTNWVNVGSQGFSAGGTGYTSLYIDDGTPYVSYRDYAYASKATVMKYDGTNWVNVGSPGFSIGVVNETNLSMYNHIPYVSYIDEGNNYKATVMKYDGTNWVSVGTQGISSSSADCISMYLYNGTPYVAYHDDAYGEKLTVRKYDGTNWVNVGSPGFSSEIVGDTSIFVYNGVPYLAYRAHPISKAKVMKYDGANWVNVGSSPYVSPASAYYLSMYISNGIIYLTYQDGNNFDRVTVMKFTL